MYMLRPQSSIKSKIKTTVPGTEKPSLDIFLYWGEKGKGMRNSLFPVKWLSKDISQICRHTFLQQIARVNRAKMMKI
jgi:hypothetical protein